MAKCPFAVWDPINGGLGAFNGEPFKIIHHTTEGSSFKGARAAFKSNKSDPHFTVDATTIHQHIDTAETARSLKNASGGVETNRSSAIQIEMVGFAGRPKAPDTLVLPGRDPRGRAHREGGKRRGRSQAERGPEGRLTLARAGA